MQYNLTRLSETLSKKSFETFVCKGRQEAVSLIESILKESAPKTIGVGSSDTLKQLALYEVFESNAETVYFHKPKITADLDRQALTCDIYFCSANAVSMDGHIVNIDGMGNRVGATCFGPKRIIYVIGKNKVVSNLEDALWRVRNVAAVGVAKKFERKTPCAVTGVCSDCNSPECVCAVTAIHRKKPYGIDITVVLVNEDLGI